jgi:phosphoserine phosphatase
MTRAAALFRLEGALVPRPAALAAAWLAANTQHLSERAWRLGAVALSAPFALGLGDGAIGQRLAWSALRGVSEDRLRVLGREYAEAQLIPAIRPLGLDLLERARRDGLAIVLLSDHVSEMAEPVAEHLRADTLLSNHLELRGGRCTGRLQDPVMSRFGGTALREWAARHGFDLAKSRAYAGSREDQILLSSIGWPCVVCPDRELRRVARDLDWPVVEGA